MRDWEATARVRVVGLWRTWAAAGGAPLTWPWVRVRVRVRVRDMVRSF